MMKEYKEIDYALARLLCDSAKKRCFNLSYGECAQELTELLHYNVNPHFGLSLPLYNVAQMCHDLGLPLITAIVRYNNPKANPKISEKTSIGFYNMACEFHPEYKTVDPVTAWKTELDRVRKCQD